jgi:chloramphenicol O-acetyltransferase type A
MRIPQKIDLSAWPRTEHYRHYIENPCFHCTTCEIDMRAVRKACRDRELRLYPVTIYIAMMAVNAVECLRLTHDPQGDLAVWDHVSPSYPIFHEDDKTFSYLYTSYESDFSKFYTACIADMAACMPLRGFEVRPAPSDSFSISALPWESYSAFSLGLSGSDRYLAPILTWGKCRDTMPLTLQINHAAADGWHMAQFMENFRRLAQAPESWL